MFCATQIAKLSPIKKLTIEETDTTTKLYQNKKKEEKDLRKLIANTIISILGQPDRLVII